jgi:hypothetical protein
MIIKFSEGRHLLSPVIFSSQRTSMVAVNEEDERDNQASVPIDLALALESACWDLDFLVRSDDFSDFNQWFSDFLHSCSYFLRWHELCTQNELMQSFFAYSKNKIRAITGNDINFDDAPELDPTASSVSRLSADACCAAAGANRATIFEPALSEGRNVPAAAGEAAHRAGGGRSDAARALANLRDAAQQLGAHSLAAAAASAAAALEPTAAAAETRSGRGCADAAAAAAALARVRRELRRAEAAWAAAECSGTARAVRVAVQSVFAGGAFLPPPLTLRFRPEDPGPAAAAAAAAAARRRRASLARLAAGGSGRALAAAGAGGGSGSGTQ